MLKGAGTWDCKWLKVVWFDMSGIGESPAEIKNVLTVTNIFYSSIPSQFFKTQMQLIRELGTVPKYFEVE